jgi:hypothetical protein
VNKARAKLRVRRNNGFAARLMIVEAAIRLGVFRLLILLVPFRWSAPRRRSESGAE